MIFLLFEKKETIFLYQKNNTNSKPSTICLTQQGLVVLMIITAYAYYPLLKHDGANNKKKLS